MDYKKIGLKCGIEIHQQLDTNKLFCNCQTSMEREPKDEIARKLRAVVGELGEVDPAAAQEVMKNKNFVYKAYEDETCLVETDSEPPHDPNPDALHLTLTVSGMLNCEIPNEVHVMRKTVLDGSVVSAFQRTALLGLDGWLKSSEGKIGITNICLEEDAAQILDKIDGTTVYGLDRLGIPLIEIGTSPDIKTPEQTKEVAQRIGMILRSTGMVKRGLGTIRQDINVSIKDGARVEMKGAQNLNLIPVIVKHEVERQLNLVALKNRLKSLGFRLLKPRIYDFTKEFRELKSPIMKNKKVFGMVIPKFEGLFSYKLTTERTFGKEIVAYVRANTDSKGYMHSDEAEKHALEEGFERVKKKVKTNKGDGIVIVSGDEKSSRKVLNVIVDRINQVLIGVPEETRKVLDDGNTEYMRPLPGAARMYPETDILPIEIGEKYLKNIMKNLPETWDRMIKRFMKQYELNNELSRQVVNSGLGKSFEEIVRIGVKPKLVATTITLGLRDIRTREAVPIEKIRNEHVFETFKAYKADRIQKENILDVLKKIAQNPNEDMEHIIKGFQSRGMTEDEVRAIVLETIKQKPGILKKDRPEKIYMGLVMARVKGKAPGNLVMKVLQEELKKA